MTCLAGKRILVTGGTGSLGQVIVRRLLNGEMGKPAKVTILSRDEAKQHEMRLSYLDRHVATDEVIYENIRRMLSFRIGDVRDYAAVFQAVCEADVVIHAAAMKQVPTCEYFTYEAVQTNIVGTKNLIRAIHENHLPVELVVGISTDKACKPINVMGMTKALMERLLVEANIGCPQTRHICVRYGNVVASRGSVVPLFLDQIARGGPVTITKKEMTRFLLSLDSAVDTVFSAIQSAQGGEIFVPQVPSVRVETLARALIGQRSLDISYIGLRPGEKLHEILVSEDECHRTILRDGHYVIRPMLPELGFEPLEHPALSDEYSSAEVTMDADGLHALLQPYVGEEPKAD